MKKSLAVLAISAASLTAMPAVASAKTLRLFSKPIPQVGGPFDANGNPLTGAPGPGAYFVGGDHLYRGTATHHARAVFGYDHIVCTILDVNAHARCNADIVLRDGVVYGTNFPLDLQAQDSVITTGLFGIGRYSHVTSITSHNVGNTDNSELTIRY
ncbi:hypothetical protein [Capillimicrobium parvum]|uniref:Uncharacterized protein n=1 Tax=Capillimicrobium parvum TaxID=2884022 RepID=A0A9E7BZC6_9ACTN|nr:hypothetical protein [Capillimicrobium parvum]UGS34362.1 hypothetical protein DSM104329_00740 [Capillimicrobium parvum]